MQGVYLYCLATTKLILSCYFNKLKRAKITLAKEMCDKLGIVTSVEIPIVNAITEDQEFLDNSINMMDEMIKQHYNNPSLEAMANTRTENETPKTDVSELDAKQLVICCL